MSDPVNPGPADPAWAEYDAAAEDLAKRGLKGDPGDPLPEGLSLAALNAINYDPEAFAEHVRATAYALAMEEVEDDRYVVSDSVLERSVRF